MSNELVKRMLRSSTTCLQYRRCKDCIFFIQSDLPANNNVGICKQFGEPIAARNDESKCGKFGKYFKYRWYEVNYV